MRSWGWNGAGDADLPDGRHELPLCGAPQCVGGPPAAPAQLGYNHTFTGEAYSLKHKPTDHLWKMERIAKVPLL